MNFKIARIEKSLGEPKIQNISRSGLEAFHMNGLFDAELKEIYTRTQRKFGQSGFILDGERFASDWTDTMNAKKSGNEDARSRININAFFIMPLSHWMAQKTDLTMKENLKNLSELLDSTPRVRHVQGREVADYQDMTAYCDEVTTPGFDGQPKGHEGLILKDWDATYAWDRTIAWCKVKHFWDADCVVVGFKPGRPKSRLENTLGRLEVIGFLEDGTRVECGVGSGFSDALRSEIWANQDKWLGRTVVIRYQEVSKARGKEVSSLRFPTYERWRDDKIIDIDS